MQLTSWLTAVASEAPSAPISSVKMNIGSSITLSIPPAAVPTIEKAAAPSERNMLLRTNVAQCTGAAISIHFAYGAA